MANDIANKHTSLDSDEVMTRAIQWFSNEKWKPTSQSSRALSFEGRMPVPWVHLLFTLIAFACLVIPGIILYILLIKRARKFQNLILTTSPTKEGGCDVTINYPGYAKKFVNRFLDSLPV